MAAAFSAGHLSREPWLMHIHKLYRHTTRDSREGEHGAAATERERDTRGRHHRAGHVHPRNRPKQSATTTASANTSLMQWCAHVTVLAPFWCWPTCYPCVRNDQRAFQYGHRRASSVDLPGRCFTSDFSVDDGTPQRAWRNRNRDVWTIHPS